MSKAEELARQVIHEWEDYALGGARVHEVVSELRRLAKVEAEHAALLKAISDAIPVFWYRPVMNGDMYEGPHHNNSFVGQLQRAEKPSEWLPLYTLEGIRK